MYYLKKGGTVITYQELKEKVLFDEKFVVVLLNKPTKASSFLMELTFFEVIENLAQKVNVYKISEKEQQKIVDDFQLFSEPLILVFVQGELKDVIYFPISRKNLQNRLSSVFNEQVKI